MLCAKAKTRQLLCDCSGALRKPGSQVCRASGIEPYESVCQEHFDKIEHACVRQVGGTYGRYMPSQNPASL